jgi:5-enolpyruvylshikimate-3-phosphate synthase
MKYRIFPPEEIIEDGIIELPLSKSLSTRGLVLDAMTQGGAVGGAYVARCDDTEVIEKALSQVEGTVDVGASGAALRFLTAYFAAKEGVEVELRGTERLHERPMGVLIEALRGCGAEIECIEEEGYAPLRINGRRLRGGEVNVDVTVSSQFVSALLMVAPMMDEGLTVRFEGEPVSLPYILMTVGMMEQRGIKVDREPLRIKVEKGSYRPFDQQPEGDWSAAAFWYEISALTAGWITVTNLKEKTLQGDKAAMRLFECLGVNTVESEELQGGLELSPSPEIYGRIDVDLTDNPDLAPALAVTCCLIGVPFKLTGLKSLGVKECDRLTALCEEKDKIGRVVEKIRDYGLEWDGKSHPVVEMPEFSSHNDHRIAMALAPVAVYVPGVVIDGCEAVSKSYPDYWRQLQKIGFRIEEVEE